MTQTSSHKSLLAVSEDPSWHSQHLRGHTSPTGTQRSTSEGQTDRQTDSAMQQKQGPGLLVALQAAEGCMLLLAELTFPLFHSGKRNPFIWQTLAEDQQVLGRRGSAAGSDTTAWHVSGPCG